MRANILAALTGLILIIGIPVAGEYLGWPMEDVVGHLTGIAVIVGIGCGMAVFYIFAKESDYPVWGFWLLAMSALGGILAELYV